MSRPCSVCSSPNRRQVDHLLVSGEEPIRSISRRMGLGKDALLRHRKVHIPEALFEARQSAEAEHGRDLLGRVRDLEDRALALLQQAERAGDLRTAIAAVREARGCIELSGKASGELVERHAHLHAAAPADPAVWLELRDTLNELNRVREQQQPALEASLARHVFQGEDALPTAWVPVDPVSPG